MIGAGVLLAMWLSERRARVEGINHIKILDLIGIVFIAALLGARLVRVTIEWADYVPDPWKALRIWEGGFDFFGGLVFAIPVGIWYLRRSGMPVLKTLDLVGTYLPLAHAFGRIGCFLEGCCHGTLTTVPWAVRFPKWLSAKDGIVGTPAFIQHMSEHLVDPSATRSLPVHPTQLYSSISLFVVFLVLLVVRRYKTSDGQVLAVYLILYGIARFLLEFLRGDALVLFFGLSLYQSCSVVLIATGIIMVVAVGQRETMRGV
jgi:phosphatidylglycerol---prolipoprotein diacylglyceryl transferase